MDASLLLISTENQHEGCGGVIEISHAPAVRVHQCAQAVLHYVQAAPPAASEAGAARAQVDVDLGDRSYPIYIGSDLLQEPHLLQQHVRGKRVLIVTNETIAPLYLDR